MAYNIERLESPVAYFLGIDKDFDITTDLDTLNHELIDCFDQEECDSFVLIADARQMQISLTDIMNGSKTTIDTGFNPNQHAKVRKTLIITDNTVLKLSLDGLRKFGIFQDAQLVKSYDEAIAIASR